MGNEPKLDIKKHFPIPIYGGWLTVIMTKEEDLTNTVKRHYKNWGDDAVDAEGLILDFKGDRTYPMVFHDNATAGVIVHEASHVTNRIFRDIGAKPTWENDEHYAYMIAWVVEKILEVQEKMQ